VQKVRRSVYRFSPEFTQDVLAVEKAPRHLPNSAVAALDDAILLL
jgi:hypothetical protein